MPSDDVPVFNPHLFDDDDDSEDVAYKTFLHSLITKRITPAHAAEALDEWVVREANTQYDRLRQRDPPFDLTPEEKESLYLVGPNPCRHVEMMVGTVAKITSAYPPGHTSQNLLIEFFQALKALPRQKVPNLSFKDHTHEPTFDVKLTLWSFGTESVEYLAQKFQREAEGVSCRFNDVFYQTTNVLFVTSQSLRTHSLKSRHPAANLNSAGETCRVLYLGSLRSS